MGEHQSIPRSFNNMKAFILFVALVAAVSAEAEAEADPSALYYGYYGHYPAYYPYGYGFYGYYHGNCKNNAGQLVPCAYHGKKKREAEADPHLSHFYGYYPYAYYGYPYQVGYHGWGVKNGSCVNAANVPVPCAFEESRKKREADPDYYAVPTAYGYPYGWGPYAFGHALVHTSHYGDCFNVKGEKVPC